MSLDLRWIRDTASVREAAVSMRDNSIGFLPVCDAGDTLVGVVTDRDLTTRVIAQDRAFATTAVGEVMSKPPIVCLEDEPISHAEEAMTDNQLSRLPVLGPGNRVVGVISLTDIVTRRRGSEALRTARAVLSRESIGPHAPLEDIHLTASEPGATHSGNRAPFDDYSRTKDEANSVAIGRYPGVR
jgi:signal-transduction protein with cAMP-binding, CBS, and nucleotidyltransferase domain